MGKKKVNEEFIERRIDKDAQLKISEDFLEYALKMKGITKEEFEEFERKIESGEIKLDNGIEDDI